ncbi:MAG: MoxR family ATPase [Oscillospiraceae bacterium]|jgi:MoxR-like ATPase|nr:MoxR family ATPase [Oscillospiraceae bacterium]
MKNNAKAAEIIDNINRSLIGKKQSAKLAVITLLSGGHLLIEDVPGVGKTTLANLLAKSVGVGFTRIQFTPDTLPGDVVGASVYDMRKGEFRYAEGAIMNNIVLVDEINRTSPKTQAALLEAMQEGQVSVDGTTYSLKEPFMLVATQNPIEFIGTYNLPEAQLDRFMMKLSLGYPGLDDEKKMAQDFISGELAQNTNAVISAETLVQMREEVKSVKVADNVAEYVINLVSLTRVNPLLSLGASPRATLALISAARGAAYVSGRNFVTPDDVQEILPHVLRHRLILTVEAKINKNTPEKIIENVKNTAKVPL